MKKIVVFGAGPAAQAVTDYIERDTNDQVVGYVVDDEYHCSTQFNNKPLVSWKTIEDYFPPEQFMLFGPISFRKLNQFRKQRFMEGKARGYSFYTYKHPNISIYTGSVGENVMIFEGCTLEPYVEIKDNCIIWSQSILGHHCIVEAHCFLSGSVIIGGRSTLGEGSFCGGRSTIFDGIHVGKGSIIAACSNLNKSVPDNTIVATDRILIGQAKRFGHKLLE